MNKRERDTKIPNEGEKEISAERESGGCLYKQDETGSFVLVTMKVDHEDMRDEKNKNRN